MITTALKGTLLKNRLALLSLGINIGLTIIYISAWLAAYQRNMTWRADFTAIYTAAALVRDGQGSRLYDLALQGQYQGELLSPHLQAGQLALPFINPPFLAVFLAPLAFLSLKSAYLVYTGIQLGLIFVFIRKLKQLLNGWENLQKWLAISAILALPMLLTDMLLGSLSLFLLVCLIQGYQDLKSGKEMRAGFWFGLLLFKPQHILLLPVFLFATRRWQIIISFIGTAIVLGLIATGLFGIQIWPSYISAMLQYNQNYAGYAAYTTAMYNLRGMLDLLTSQAFPQITSMLSYLALGITALLIFTAIWREQPAANTPRWLLWLSVTLTLSFFLSPHLNPQDGLLFVLPIIIYYTALKMQDTHYPLLNGIFLASPLLCLVFEFSFGEQLPLRAPVVLILIILFIIARELIRRYQGPPLNTLAGG